MPTLRSLHYTHTNYTAPPIRPLHRRRPATSGGRPAPRPRPAGRHGGGSPSPIPLVLAAPRGPHRARPGKVAASWRGAGCRRPAPDSRLPGAQSFEPGTGESWFRRLPSRPPQPAAKDVAAAVATEAQAGPAPWRPRLMAALGMLQGKAPEASPAAREALLGRRAPWPCESPARTAVTATTYPEHFMWP